MSTIPRTALYSRAQMVKNLLCVRALSHCQCGRGQASLRVDRFQNGLRRARKFAPLDVLLFPMLLLMPSVTVSFACHWRSRVLSILASSAVALMVLAVGAALGWSPSAAAQELPKSDQYRHAGLSPEDAARAMTVPPGFKVTLFAGEPDIQQPIAMAIDDRGRLWVAEAYAYPIRVPDTEARDRILIFEDTDHDGHFDTRKVFYDKLNLVSGLELGFGGVWVGAAPHLLFIPDADGDDQPDAAPQIVLDGWGYGDTHETLNAFIWGPDGWLYGCHGVFTTSRVGKPGTPDEQRIPINAGIWRYHPTRQVFEAFAHGTSNPWGVDFNDRGQAFLTACVIPHLYHIIQGARYQRQSGSHFNPYTYADIQTIARHRHWVGSNPHRGNNLSDSAGGGHAHAGAMLYLGGSWPSEYRDQIFMNNIHGARLNQDRLEPQGSGYVGDRAPDFLFANDSWSQILYLTYGPDGQVYMIDWYDQNQCHHSNNENHDRRNGRVFKISYKNAQPTSVNLKKLSDSQLVDLQLNANDWYVRHARRILQERGKQPAVHEQLCKTALSHPDETRRLRALWALHVTDGLGEQELLAGLKDESPYVRGWSVQLVCERGRPANSLIQRFAELATNDPSPIVRLYLASACPQLPTADGIAVLRPLLRHREDQSDHNLPLMYWYAAEAVATADPAAALSLWTDIKLPIVQSYLVRRLTQPADPKIVARVVSELLARAMADEQLLVLRAINEGLAAQRLVEMPSGWSTLYARLSSSPDADVRSQATILALTFGDAGAAALLEKMLADEKAPLEQRLDALSSLLRVHAANLPAALQRLVTAPGLSGPAIRALASYDDTKSVDAIISAYPQLAAAERRDALTTLASRPAFARLLLTAVDQKRIPAADLSAELARQLRNLKDPQLDEMIARVWGTLQDTPAEKAAQIKQVRSIFSTHGLPANRPEITLGRAVFAKTCQQCHVLFGVGGKIGPELTGSNRANLDYVLQNILDPSAAIGKDYLAHVIVTKDGRTLTGIVREENANALTLVTANEVVIVPKSEIEDRVVSAKSMMPDDLIKPLSQRELRSLVVYLASPAQVPMLATGENAKAFFNGRDLTGWTGNSEVWSVADGVLVGRTSKSQPDEFLVSDLIENDFTLSFEALVVGEQSRGGVRFRNETIVGSSPQGYRFNMGGDGWGKLDEPQRRGMLWPKSGESHVQPGKWNRYKIEAQGSIIRTWINDQLCTDLDDPQGSQRGTIALELPSGGPTEVQFRNLVLSLPAKPQ